MSSVTRPVLAGALVLCASALATAQDKANPKETSSDGPPTYHEGARGWFSIWEGSIPADLSGGFCRDLLNQVIDLGEPIKAGMTAAEDVARRALSPGEIREIRRRYTLDWDGWALAPPKGREP